MAVELQNRNEDRPISERVVTWFDRLAREHGCDGYSLFQLYMRYANYYGERLPSLRVVPGEPNWRCECPFCAHEMAINSMTGWWACGGCQRQGEIYAMEYMLYGEGDPMHWERCRAVADALMEGVPANLRGGREVTP